jgi:hypothetical protein
MDERNERIALPSRSRFFGATLLHLAPVKVVLDERVDRWNVAAALDPASAGRAPHVRLRGLAQTLVFPMPQVHLRPPFRFVCVERRLVQQQVVGQRDFAVFLCIVVVIVVVIVGDATFWSLFDGFESVVELAGKHRVGGSHLHAVVQSPHPLHAHVAPRGRAAADPVRSERIWWRDWPSRRL